MPPLPSCRSTAHPTPSSAHHAVDHDYVVVSDRFGSAAPWPSNGALLAAGGFAAHFAHMRAFWNAQLAGIAQINVPERSLVDAYKSGFITTQITRSGNDLDTGVNGYESEFSHDVVGILTNLFTQGSYSDAHALLTEARAVVGAPGQYVDGLWTYSVPWAVYLLKTGDKAFVRAELRHRGQRRGGAEPRRGRARHRGRPHGADGDDGGHRRHRHAGILDRPTTSRPCSAWPPTGPSRRPSATPAEASWASTQYASLLAATDAVLDADNQPGPPRLPALLPPAAQHRQPLRQPRRTPTGPRRSATGPGRLRSSVPPSAARA